MEFKNRLNIDLHIHSTASDGTLSPQEILTQADKLGLGAIAITDHDTLAGSEQALTVGVPSGIGFLTGVEISANPPPKCDIQGSFHILGYGVSPGAIPLNSALHDLQEARKKRTPLILERLEDLGLPLEEGDVRIVAGSEGQIGRPHIARAMVLKGYVHSMDDAFDRFLGTNKPAYVSKYRIECIEAIELIRDAGGIPVLAHPFLYRRQKNIDLIGLLRALLPMGLKGLEVYYPEHSVEDTLQFASLAKSFGLLMTGGTDFHGSIKEGLQMGTGFGDFHVPYAVFEKLTAAVSRSAASQQCGRYRIRTNR